MSALRKLRGVAVPAAATVLLGVLWAVSLRKSLTGDEAYAAALAGSRLHSLLSAVALDCHVPGYFLALWVWVGLFGSSLLVIRLSSLLCGAASLGFASRRGAAAAMLMACNPFMLHISTEIRMYGLLALAGVLFALLLTRLEKGCDPRAMILLRLLSMASVWIHYFAWPLVLASILVLLRLGRRRDAAILLGLSAASILPWLPSAAGQLDRFGPGAESVSSGLTERADLLHSILGIPFSLAGTLLRFSAGTAPFRFEQFSISGMGPWALAGVIVMLLYCAAVFAGLGRSGFALPAILVSTLLPLSLLRPSARHMAGAFPAFVMLAAAGVSRLPARLRWILPAASLAMCIPFAARTTLPQRCRFDRDLMEAAEVAAAASDSTGAPVVLFLDNFTSLALLYHLEDEGHGSVPVWSPHARHFTYERYFYVSVTQAVAYLTGDTDSLFSALEDSLGGGFVLVANDPREVRGPRHGPGGAIVGTGSDTMADADLIEALEDGMRLEELPLRHSEGPFSVFLATPRDR